MSAIHVNGEDNMDLVEEQLRNSQTIAVVGLSDNPERFSYRVAKYLQDQGYRIIPVNPMLEEVLGEKSYPDLNAVPEPIDMVECLFLGAYEATAIGSISDSVKVPQDLDFHPISNHLWVINRGSEDSTGDPLDSSFFGNGYGSVVVFDNPGEIDQSFHQTHYHLES